MRGYLWISNPLIDSDLCTKTIKSANQSSLSQNKNPTTWTWMSQNKKIKQAPKPRTWKTWKHEPLRNFLFASIDKKEPLNQSVVLGIIAFCLYLWFFFNCPWSLWHDHLFTHCMSNILHGLRFFIVIISRKQNWLLILICAICALTWSTRPQIGGKFFGISFPWNETVSICQNCDLKFPIESIC